MILRIAAILLAAISLPGCISVHHAEPRGYSSDAAAVQHVDPRAWPERWAPQRRRVKGVIVPLTGEDRRLVPIRIPRGHTLDTLDEDLVDAGVLYGLRKPPPGSFTVYERDGAFLFRSESSAPEPRADMVFKFVSGRMSQGDDPGAPGMISLERTWFAYYDAENAPTRALVLLLPGMFGTPTPVIDGLINRLRAEGYGVLRMLSHPSRFTERVTFTIDPDAPDEGAKRVSDVLTGRAAECAYAAEAAFEHLTRERPELARLRRVAVGMSGGAMVLPTVLARDPDAYSAALLIAGGCNFWLINERSNYAGFIDAIDTEWTRGPTRDERDAFSQAYLRHAPLDSYHTARALHDLPILMIHGSGDRAVPARQGDLLWERLGRPERRVVPVGHEMLFFSLGTHYDAIFSFFARHALDAGS